MLKNYFLSLVLLIFCSIGYSQTTITYQKDTGGDIQMKTIVVEEDADLDKEVKSLKLPNKVEKRLLQDISDNYQAGESFVWQNQVGKTNYKFQVGDTNTDVQINGIELPRLFDLDGIDNNVLMIGGSQAYLGLGYEAFDFKNDTRSDVRGVTVTDVVAGETAFNAGLEEGDVITAVNGVATPSPSLFKDAVSELEPRKTVVFTINRDGKEHNLSSLVGKSASPFNFFDKGESVVEHPFLKMDLENILEGVDLSGDLEGLKQQLENMNFDGLLNFNDKPRLGVGIENSEDGVIITNVERGSVADKSGIKNGDVITKFNGQDIEVVSNLIDAIEKVDFDDEVEVEILRDGKQKTIKAKIKKKEMRKVIIKGQKG